MICSLPSSPWQDQLCLCCSQQLGSELPSSGEALACIHCFPLPCWDIAIMKFNLLSHLSFLCYELNSLLFASLDSNLLLCEILRNQRFQVYNISVQAYGALPIALMCDYIFCHRLARDAAFARFAMALVAASVLGRHCQCCVLQSGVVIFKHITPTLKVHHQLV